jgi:hypothetical protein
MDDKDILEIFETNLEYIEVLKKSIKSKEDVISHLGDELKKKDLRVDGLLTEVRILRNQLNRRV